MRSAPLVFLVVCLGAIDLEASDLGEHLERIRAASPERLPAALEEAAQALRLPSGKADPSTCASLLAEARKASSAKGPARAAGWKLAGAAFARSEDPSPDAAAWLLEHVDDVWKQRVGDELGRAAIVAASRVLFGAAESESGKAERAIKKALRTKDDALFVSLALGLAGVASERARALLARVVPRKKLDEDEVAAIVRALGEAGGAGAAPILLAHVPDSEAVVLQEALVGLGGLDAAALRAHGKKILAVTMKDNEASYRELLALSNKTRLSRKEQRRKSFLEARGRAWITDRIVDTPPMKVPEGVGMRGVAALWWKVIDSLEGKIDPPEPPENARPKFLNGRPNVQGLNWFLWWRSAR